MTDCGCCKVTLPNLNEDALIEIVGLNITSNLLLVTPPAAPGDPIALDLTVTGTGGIVVTNPLPGVLNIDGSGVGASFVDDGFGTTVRGDGSLVTPYRVDSQISSNSLLITPPIINGDPVAVDLTITGTNGITTTNPAPGTWNISGEVAATFNVIAGFVSGPWAPILYTVRYEGYRFGQRVTIRMTQVVIDTVKNATASQPFVAPNVIPLGFRPSSVNNFMSYGIVTAGVTPTVAGRVNIGTAGTVAFGGVNAADPFPVGQPAGLEFGGGELEFTYIL